MSLRLLTAIACTAALAAAGGARGTLVLPPGGPAAPSAGDAAATVFVLTGAGNGHGVGLSQYGALAQARAGRSAADILAFYYPGTRIERRPSQTVRVLLAAAAKTVALSSTAPLRVRDAAGRTLELPAGKTTLGPDLVLPVDGAPTPLAPPLTVTPAAGAFVGVGASTYRGKVEVAPAAAAGRLQVVDVVGLEAYLQGVVPAEVPASWPAAALQAQAVAARSYALATVVEGKPWDLFPDGRSQQYRGAGAETPETTAAVKATAGQTLMFGQTVATALYSSSSGGRTQSGLDAFGLDLPYLRAQADPWDAASPFHAWTPRALTGAEIAGAVGLKTAAVDVTARFSPSGRVAALTVTGADGSTLALAGTEARTRLQLRSTAFHLATLRLAAPLAAATRGTALRLTGVARDAPGGAALEALAADGTWQPVVRKLHVDAAGTFAAVVRPRVTTTYRLSTAGVAGPALTVPVVEAGA
jgi:stage II sporulation protein D